MTFKVDSNYIIKHRIITDNAQANGGVTNAVEFSFINATSYEPAVALPVVIETNGSAIIKESNSSIFKTVTDGNGKVVSNITDTVHEDITVATFVIFSLSDSDRVKLKFKPISDRFYISSATNANHTFTRDQPKTAWAGASFTLNTVGGSNGKIEWKWSGATEEIVVEGNDLDRTAGVTIKARTYQPCIINATDTITGESDQYILEVENLLQPECDKRVFHNDAKKNHPDSLVSLDIYKQLYAEWGDMSAYTSQGWKVDDVYWTSDEVFGGVKVYDLQSGTDNTSGTFLVEHYYSFIVGN